MDPRNTKIIVIAAGAVLGALLLATLVAMALQMQAATAQERATLQLAAAQQSGPRHHEVARDDPRPQ